MFTRISPVAYATGLFVFGVMGARPLVTLYAIDIGVGAGEVGILVSLFSLIPLGLAVFMGKMMDQYGTRAALLISVFVTFVGLSIPFILSGRVGLYLSQLITGTGFTIFILAAQKRSSSEAVESAREHNIAIFSMSVALGGAIGPLLTGFWGDFLGIQSTFGILALVVLGSILFLVPLISDRSNGVNSSPLDFNNPLRVFSYNQYMFRAFLISSLVLIGRDMYVAYFPLYANSIGISASMIGVIIGIHNSGGVLVRYFLLKLINFFGKNMVVVLSIALGGLAFVSIPFTQNITLLILISLAMGIGLGIGQPLSISTTVNLSPVNKIGEVLGVRLSCNRVTQVIAPISFAGIVTVTGIAGIFLIIGVLLIAGSTRVSIPNEKNYG